MNPESHNEPIPRDEIFLLIGPLNEMQAKIIDAAQQWELLDEAGHVPAAPPYIELLQHAIDAQGLSLGVHQLAADFARNPYSKTRDGGTVLALFAAAAAISTQAAPYFAETAQGALSFPRAGKLTELRFVKNRMVIDHASGRACLRRTSGSLRAVAKELDNQLDFHRYLSTVAPRESPAPPPPKPNGHHR
ncbi:hypothetical protein [Streptomyces sp. SID1121]|uniref:hypothetical protein n=1 Tax=Streptomyces sp. SID1121 TaxID=3425888 RepID=UPI004057C53D